MNKIPITIPYITSDEINAVAKVLKSGWLVQGPNVRKFEELFMAFTGAKYAVATSNCTTALHLSLKALGVGHGDTVVVPSYTYIASANAIEHSGAIPVFCDISINDYSICIDSLKKVISELICQGQAPKAVMPVSLNGVCANMPGIVKIAKSNNMLVIEDAACGLGAYIDGKHSGTFGDTGCFSFHPRKNITTAEGGMLVTNSDTIASIVVSMRDHGANKSDFERHKHKGFLLPDFNYAGMNYRMTDLQGAIGVCQMNKLEYIQHNKNNSAQRYLELLGGIDKLRLPPVIKGRKHGWQSFMCLYTGGASLREIQSMSINDIDKLCEERNTLMQRLDDAGIATRQGSHAVHTLRFYNNKYHHNAEDFKMSYAADRLGMTIPHFTDITIDNQQYVVDKIKEFI